MNKELLIKLATGLVAKGIRYALTAAGGTAAATSDGDVSQIASGVAMIVVSIAWSIAEDKFKAKAKVDAPQP